MIKILIVGMDNSLGGLNIVIINIIKALVMKNINIHFDLLLPSGDVKYEVPANTKVINNDVSFIKKIKYKSKIKDIINKNKYNFIWINTSNACNLILLRTIKKYCDAKIIVHSHGSGIDVKSKLKEKILFVLHKINIRKFNKLIDIKFACGKKAGKWLFNTLDGVKIIPNAIDVNKFKFDYARRRCKRKILEIDDEAVVLIHVGRFMPVKNHEFLIDIFHKLVENSNVEYKLILIGSGELREAIKNKVSFLNLENKVFFLGDRYDIPDFLSAADIFLLPSLHEGFPVTLIEAQSSGLPCIISDNISREVNIEDLVQFVSVNDLDSWVNHVKFCRIGFDRTIYFDKFKKSGFDINLLINDMLECFNEK